MSMYPKHLAVWIVLDSLLLMGVTSVVEAGEPLEKVRSREPVAPASIWSGTRS